MNAGVEPPSAARRSNAPFTVRALRSCCSRVLAAAPVIRRSGPRAGCRTVYKPCVSIWWYWKEPRLDVRTVHDLGADVAGALEALDCGPAHLVGHAFGNRVARCLAVDRPSLVRNVTLLGSGGLIGPATPLGTGFVNATEVKMNGSDCVTLLGLAGVRSENTRAGRMLAGGASRPSRDQPGGNARGMVGCRNSPASCDPGAR